MRAVRALQSADVILFDHLVAAGVLDFARREARKMIVGKTGYGPACKQDETVRVDDLARQGRQAGSSAQGRRSADLRARRRGARRLSRRRPPVEAVPGITAAQGAAAGSASRSLTVRSRAGFICHRPWRRRPPAVRHRLEQHRGSDRDDRRLYARQTLRELAESAIATASTRRRLRLPSSRPRGPVKGWSRRDPRPAQRVRDAGLPARCW